MLKVQQKLWKIILDIQVLKKGRSMFLENKFYK